MIDLASNSNGKFISLKEIANRQEISMKYLEQLISILNKAGYLQSLRGNNGGYKLAKAPKDYRVGDILRTMEGDLSPIVCITEDKNKCQIKELCKTHDFWIGLDKVIEEYVDSKTLQDLI